jgi:methylmalonyl-CoA mutase C-terminal domain/subunit
MTGRRRLSRVVLIELCGEGQAIMLARALRDAGAEVVYAGRMSTTPQVTSTVEQEDPDALGLAVDAGTDPAMLAEVAAAHSGVRVFGWGTAPNDFPATFRVFDAESEVTDWLSGVATHIAEAPSDRGTVTDFTGCEAPDLCTGR